MCSERPVNSFRTKLISIADNDYREFVTRGIPCERPILGARIPEIRKLVKEVPLEDFDGFLQETPIALEEVLARGFLIARLSYEEMLKCFDSQIKFLDNWCTVDTFVASFRKAIKHHELDFLDRKVEPLLKSKNEFAIRAGLVCLLDFYVDFDHLFLIFDRLEYLKEHDEYYVKMSLAWLLAECFIKYPDETFIYLQYSNLPKWTFNKAISKICDSRRIVPENKTKLKQLRKA